MTNLRNPPVYWLMPAHLNRSSARARTKAHDAPVPRFRNKLAPQASRSQPRTDRVRDKTPALSRKLTALFRRLALGAPSPMAARQILKSLRALATRGVPRMGGRPPSRD